MTLAEVRELFKKASGRYDLCTEAALAGVVNCDVYIRAGQMFLDERYDIEATLGWHLVDLAVGTKTFLVRDLRIPEKGTCRDSNGELTDSFEYKPFDEMLALYPDLPEEIDSGTPTYWTWFPSRLAPNLRALTAETYTTQFTQGVDFVDFSNPDRDKLIWVAPTPDEVCTIGIYGRFFSKLLTADADQNFWTLRHPDVLVLSALMKLEALNYRNAAGAAAAEQAIERALFGTQTDLAEYEGMEALKSFRGRG